MLSNEDLIAYIKQLERRLAFLERLEGAGGGVTDHGGLTGLGDDDHSLYLLASAAGGRTTFGTNWTDLTDAGNTTLHGHAAYVGITNAFWVDLTDNGETQVHKHDHGLQNGLADDDHTGYARLAGRSGGQSLIGGTAANDDLILEGTSNATRTSSYITLQPNGGNVGIGRTPATFKFEVEGNSLLNNTSVSATTLQATSFSGTDVGVRLDFSTDVTNASMSLRLAKGTQRYTTNAAMTSFLQYGSAVNQFEIVHGTSTRLSIDGNGAVGIGVGVPNQTLHVFANGNITNFLLGERDASGYAHGMLSFDRTAASNCGLLSIYAVKWGTNYGSVVLQASGGNVGVGATSPGGKLDVQQSSSAAAIPALVLNQTDLSEEFIEFDGTVAAGNPIDTAAIGTYYGKIRVSVNGTFKYIPLYNS